MSSSSSSRLVMPRVGFSFLQLVWFGCSVFHVPCFKLKNSWQFPWNYFVYSATNPFCCTNNNCICTADAARIIVLSPATGAPQRPQTSEPPHQRQGGAKGNQYSCTINSSWHWKDSCSEHMINGLQAQEVQFCIDFYPLLCFGLPSIPFHFSWKFPGENYNAVI